MRQFRMFIPAMIITAVATLLAAWFSLTAPPERPDAATSISKEFAKELADNVPAIKPTPSPAVVYATPAATPVVVSIGQQVHVGHFVYYVNGVQNLPEIKRSKPDSGNYVVIHVTAANQSKESRIIPQMVLLDYQERNFDSSMIFGLENDFSGFEKLNPGISKRGQVVFDAPQGKYLLKLKGGMLESDTVYVRLF